MKKTGKITTKFIIIFVIFTVLILIVTGVVTYFNQLNIYTEQCRNNAYNVCGHLKHMMEMDKDDILSYQNFFLEHRDEIDVPIDFTDYNEFKDKFFSLFTKKYPGKTLGVDIMIQDTDMETQIAYYTYRHAYWLELFENSRDDLDLEYTYYVTADEKPLHMTYILDAMREPRENDSRFINLGITVEEKLDMHTTMWEAYNTGKNPEGFDDTNNEFGHVYSFNSPLVLDGKVMGVVCVDVAVSTFNHNLLINTLRLILVIAIVLICGMMMLVVLINHFYIKKLVRLEDDVVRYSESKDSGIAKDIEKNTLGNDEISRLSERVAIMILDLDNYMKSLVKTADELLATKEKATVMSELATKDSLTGIRNRLAYDEEVKKLDLEISNGNTDFGLGIVDLNYLKQINDKYGHEHGNQAIKNLCYMICTLFGHSPVFRIGGDEFAIILKNNDLENIESLSDEFYRTIKLRYIPDSDKPWDHISAALGYAIFNPETDTNVDDVFQRADRAMYSHKTAMKANRTE